MKMNINRKLLPMKAHFFLFNAGTSPVVPFMPTLARQLGFSSIAVGTMYTILPVVGMLAKPLFGILADRYQRHKLLFILSQLLTAISFFCIMFIPPIPQPPAEINFDCNNGAQTLRFCPNNTKIDECKMNSLEDHYKNQIIQCHIECSVQPWQWNIICNNWNIIEPGKCDNSNTKLDFDVLLNMDHMLHEENCTYFMHLQGKFNEKNMTMYCPTKPGEPEFTSKCELMCNEDYMQRALTEFTIENNKVSSLYQFWLFFMLMMSSWCGMAIAVSVGDAICFELLGDKYYLYGNQRLWGAIGWGVFSIISGVLVDVMSGGSDIKNYTIVFWLALIILSFDMFASSKLPETKTTLSSNILHDIVKIFLSARVIIFFSWCICVGLCTALIWNFLFWYLEDLSSAFGEKNCNDNYVKTLQGLAMGIQCFGGELPFFFLSGWILKKIGHVNAMSLVLIGFGVRFTLYSMLTNPWWVLPIELMNGVTFGIFYSTMASYASIVAPPGTEATLQGLVGAIFEGVGVSIGSLIGGILFQKIGGAQTFKIFGMCAFAASFVHILIQFVLGKYFVKRDGYTSNCHTPLVDEDEA